MAGARYRGNPTKLWNGEWGVFIKAKPRAKNLLAIGDIVPVLVDTRTGEQWQAQAEILEIVDKGYIAIDTHKKQRNCSINTSMPYNDYIDTLPKGRPYKFTEIEKWGVFIPKDEIKSWFTKGQIIDVLVQSKKGKRWVESVRIGNSTELGVYCIKEHTGLHSAICGFCPVRAMKTPFEKSAANELLTFAHYCLPCRDWLKKLARTEEILEEFLKEAASKLDD